MADNEVRIRLKLDEKTTAQLKAEAKEAKKSIEGMLPSASDLSAKQSEYRAYVNEIHTRNQTLYSDNAKMKEQYFQLGTEMRSWFREQRLQGRVFREVTDSVGGLAAAVGSEGLGKQLGGLFGKFDQMEFALSGVSMAAQSAGGKIAEMGRNLAGFAVAGAVGIAAVMQMVSVLTELDKKTTELQKQYDEVQKKLHPGTPQERMASTGGQLATQRANLRTLQGANISFWDWIKDPGAALYMGKEINKEIAQVQLNIANLELEQKTAGDEYWQTFLKRADERDKLEEQAAENDIRRAEKVAANQAYRDVKGLQTRYTMRGFATSVKIPSAPATLGGVAAKPENWSELSAKSTKIQWQDLTDAQQVFFNAGMDGIHTLSMGVTSIVGGAWRRMFGETDSLFGAMIESMVARMASGFVEKGIKSLLSMIPGVGWLADLLPFAQGGIINEPVLGFGRSGHAYLLGEAGPERVSPINYMGGGGGGAQTVHVEFGKATLRGHDIYLSVKAVTPTMRQVSYGGA